jgi:hypothetical protein
MIMLTYPEVDDLLTASHQSKKVGRVSWADRDQFG